MSLERTGIVEQRQRDRATFGHHWAKPDRVPVKSHMITVDLRTGERKISPPPLPPAKPNPPRKRQRYIIAKHGGPVGKILAAVGEAYQISPWSLVSPNKSNRTARPRFAACKLLRDKREMSFPQIGRSLKRDHSTCVHEYRRANELLATDPQWAANYHAAELALCRK